MSKPIKSATFIAVRRDANTAFVIRKSSIAAIEQFAGKLLVYLDNRDAPILLEGSLHEQFMQEVIEYIGRIDLPPS